MADVLYFKINTAARTTAEITALIASLDAIISELLNTALRAVAQGDIAEYDIQTGQTIHRVKYSNQKTITEAIQGYEKLRQYYANKCIPRKKKLVHAKNFRR